MRVSILLLMPFFLMLTSCEGEVSSDCSQLCDELYESEGLELIFNNHGDCRSLCATCNNPSVSEGNTAVCICNFYDAFLNGKGMDWKDVGIKNKGECIKRAKAIFFDD